MYLLRSGDLVKVTGTCEQPSTKEEMQGRQGRIITTSFENFGVDFGSEFKGGHNLEGLLTTKTGYFIPEASLSLVDEADATKFRYGLELECMAEVTKVQKFKEELKKEHCPFTVGSDGSLHPEKKDDQTIEIRCQYAMSMEEFETNVIDLCARAAKYDVHVNVSCGYHLHMSHPDFLSKEMLTKIVFFWVSIEDVLFSTQPNSRLGNNYCRRKLREYLDTYGNDLPTAKQALIGEMQNRDRYYTLNLASLYEFGTLECRLHAGTVNQEKIIAWAKLLTAIYEYCFSRYDKTEARALFDMPISDAKVLKVTQLLQLDATTNEVVMGRIEKFGWERLIRQQQAAMKVLALKPKELAVRKKFSQIDKELRKVSDEIHNELMSF